MAIHEIKTRDWQTDKEYKEFQCETRADIAALPQCGVGSKAYVEEDESEWRLSINNVWVEKKSPRQTLIELYDEMSQYPHKLTTTAGEGTTLTVKRTVIGGAVSDDTTFITGGIVYNRDVLEITVLPEESAVTVNGEPLEGTEYVVGMGADVEIVSAVAEGE